MSYQIRDNPANTKNYTKTRLGFGIKGIVIHHAATTNFDGIGATFQNPNRGASAHYGVGTKGNVDRYVPESSIAWHAGDWLTNARTVGIENVNSSGSPEWDVSDATFNTLVELVHDIAVRNSLLPLRVGKNLMSTGEEAQRLSGHKDWSATSCPGVLYPRLEELATKVNKLAAEDVGEVEVPKPNKPDQVLHVGEKFKFTKTYRVDGLAKVGGIWQVYTKELCPVDFNWNDNGIPVDPLVEVAGGTGNSKDQVLQVGSKYTIPGTYTVLDLGAYKGRWLAKIKMGVYTLWVDIATVTEV